MDTKAPAVTLAGVVRTFNERGREIWALRDVDLLIQPGSFAVLMGPSGSGKTTLLNLAGGLDQPTAGVVTVAGQRLDALHGSALAALRRRTGFIFQSFALLPSASAYENVEMGLRLSRNVPRKEWDTRIRRCMAAVGLTAWIDHRPYELSGGQQQRVAIARALVIRPRLILADEPTGDLDSTAGQQMLSLLRALVDHEGVTLLMATHDPVAADFATDLYQLRDGQIISHTVRNLPPNR